MFLVSKKVVILHQGPREDLLRNAFENFSENTHLYTNLFELATIIEVEDGFFLENNQIHRTTQGESDDFS